jgi:hypothetical protein
MAQSSRAAVGAIVFLEPLISFSIAPQQMVDYCNQTIDRTTFPGYYVAQKSVTRIATIEMLEQTVSALSSPSPTISASGVGPNIRRSDRIQGNSAGYRGGPTGSTKEHARLKYPADAKPDNERCPVLHCTCCFKLDDNRCRQLKEEGHKTCMKSIPCRLEHHFVSGTKPDQDGRDWQPWLEFLFIHRSG